MSKRRGSEFLGFNRSTTSVKNKQPDNSNIGSFAAHKVEKNDMTNASHQVRGGFDDIQPKEGRKNKKARDAD